MIVQTENKIRETDKITKNGCCYGDLNPSRRSESLAITNVFPPVSHIQIMDDAPIFTKEELDDYINQISRDLDKTTKQTNIRFARDFVYPCTNGVINNTTTSAVIDKIIAKYQSFSSRHKGLGFFKRYLNFLNDTKEINLIPFIKQIELVKLKKPKQINKDIIFDDDIRNLIKHIEEGRNNIKNPDNAIALVYFMAYNGMREATCDRLTVKHIKDALSLSPNPCIHVESDIDKTETEHYVPIHPQLIPILNELIKGKDDNDTIFDSEKVATFLKNHRLHQINIPTKYILVKHLRKYFIQKSIEIGLNNDYRDYIVSNQMNSVQWQHYKNFSMAQIYKEYIRAWGPVKFVDNENKPVTLKRQITIPATPAIMDERVNWLINELESIEPIDPEEDQEKIQQLQIEELERRERKEYLEELIAEKNIPLGNVDEFLNDDRYFEGKLKRRA